MSTMLVRGAAVLVTMDEERREIKGGGLFVRDGFVEQVGPSADLPSEADVRSWNFQGSLYWPKKSARLSRRRSAWNFGSDG